MKKRVVLGVVWVAMMSGVIGFAEPEGEFIRRWLLCGPFPNPPNKEAVPGEDHVYDHTPPCVGLDTDYLVEHGGEAKIVPVAGMTHTKKDGSSVSWFEHTSPEFKVIFRKAITKEPNVVAYAYTTIQAEAAGPYLFSLGSDEGVCIWVNGERVHYNLISRKIVAGDDLVAVTLKKGANRVLVKVEQGHGGWGFALRVIPADGIIKSVETDVEQLTISASFRKRARSAPQKVKLVLNGQTVGEGVFAGEEEGGVADVTIKMPFPPLGTDDGSVDVVVDGKTLEHIALRDLNKARAEAFKWQTPRGYPGCVFAGTTFPRLDFERPLWVERLIGPYTISATYYDADYNVVESAGKPGRYGAVVDIVSPALTTRRFVTLYRQPSEFSWWRHKLEGGVVLPEALGISSQVAADYADHVKDFVKWQIGEGLARHTGGAVLLAALQEAESDGVKAGYYASPGLRDRAWWLPLKRKLYGADRKYPEAFVCPTKLEGPPARTVREGSLRDAGMIEDFAKKLDAHLKAWEADTDEAFAVIVVRHGVIAFHKAYGTRNGKPMTLDTKSWMASTTKMMSGSLIMMLVDQGLIALDDRADQFLPPLQEAPAEWPATIRNLYRHTAGMSGHWGSWFSDMEYRVAEMTPYYELGKQYEYDGAGLDLSCKILELISGETLPAFFQNHLLKPLGCDGTNVDNACGSADSIPLDMARIGQMLLQKGSYGNMRFFTADTFEQMLPQPVVGVKNPPWDGSYGIGTGWFKGEGLGEGTFAHGAASSAFTRIDPVNDLVIVMTRNARGENFAKYDKAFFKIIVEGMVPEEREASHAKAQRR